jgi:hypothetical protein
MESLEQELSRCCMGDTPYVDFAAYLFNVSRNSVTKDQRSIAKQRAYAYLYSQKDWEYHTSTTMARYYHNRLMEYLRRDYWVNLSIGYS